MNIETIHIAVAGQLSSSGAAWLAFAQQQIADDPTALVWLFPAAGRKCGREPLPALAGWTMDEAVRTVLLTGASINDIATLYRYGDAAERRGVLRALPLLDLGDAAVPLVEDALRTNDTRLIAAAVGPYAAEHLPPQAWRQAVLKCVFVGIRLDEVAGLAGRADEELVRMMRGYAEERRAAGRPVPADVCDLLEA